MAILYELLAGGDRPRGSQLPDELPEPTPIGEPREQASADLRPRLARRGAAPERDLILHRATVLDPRAGSSTRRDPRGQGRGARGSRGGRRSDSGSRRGRPPRSRPSSTRTCTSAPPAARTGGHRDRLRAAAAGGYCGLLAMASTEPPVTRRPRSSRCASAQADASLRRLPRHVDAGDAGRRADRHGGAGRRGRRGLLGRRPAGQERPRDAPGVPVPGARGRPDRAPRGGSELSGKGVMHEGESRPCSAWRACRRSPSPR